MTSGLVAYSQQEREKRKKEKLHVLKLKVLQTTPGKVRAQKLFPTTSRPSLGITEMFLILIHFNLNLDILYTNLTSSTLKILLILDFLDVFAPSAALNPQLKPIII